MKMDASFSEVNKRIDSTIDITNMVKQTIDT